jgi:hypothetical protein
MSSSEVASLLRLVTVFGATEFVRPDHEPQLVAALRVVLGREPARHEIQEFREALACYAEVFREGGETRTAQAS